MKCEAINGFLVCELEKGHACRHRQGNTETWTDELVTAARAQARQNKEKPDGEPLEKLLACLENVSTAIDWRTDTRQKVLWLDGILERYRATRKI